jgi:DNA-binding LacI/PurR family transcriptional regulator
MKPLRVKTSSEQVADHLRAEIMAGTWPDAMPGEGWLVSELGVGRDTVKAALAHLERKGLLQSRGAGRRRLIVLPKKTKPSTLQVRILLYEPNDSGYDYMVDLRHQLEMSGHGVHYAPKTLVEIQQNPKQVEKLVRAHPADAWIVQAGSRSVLEWFSQSGIPAFALFGRMTDLPIAGSGPDKAPALRELAHRLVDLGHQRIVMLVREERRKPHLGPNEQLFLDELKSRGIPVGSYNVPDWKDSPSGFQDCLEQLFRVTPPTALFLDTNMLFYAAQHYLARHPQHDLKKVSLFCSDYDPLFEWCAPSVACFHYDLKPVVRRVVRWVNKVGSGQEDKRQTFTKVKFIEGETIKSLSKGS